MPSSAEPAAPAPGEPTVHGVAIALGELGVLLTGPAQSGKTSLALAALDARAAQGGFAALVADDRVVLRPAHGRLIARAPVRLAGLAEVAGVGIVTVPALPEVRLTHAAALIPAEGVPRLPEPRTHTVHGIALPAIVLPARHTALALRLLFTFLDCRDLTASVARTQRPR